MTKEQISPEIEARAMELAKQMQAEADKASEVKLEDVNPTSSLDDLLKTEIPKMQPFTPESNAEIATKDDNRRVIDNLTPERKQMALKLASELKAEDSDAVLTFGSNAQNKLTTFSGNMLKHVSNSDVGPVGETLTSLMTELASADPKTLSGGTPNIFRKIFGKVKQSIAEASIKYQNVGNNIDNIAKELEKSQVQLLNDNKVLEELYHQNKDFFDALNIYIAAGEVKLDELNNEVLPEALERAKDSSDQMVAQEVKDIQEFANRLEKRVYDLKIARQITIQQAPQVRLIQNTNTTLAEKIQSSITTAIPLWKNQVVIALTLLRQQDTSTAQRQVSMTTNELLKKNSEMLKISAIETAEENERGMVDIETLQITQRNLIETIEETMTIQKSGREARANAEIELQSMELELKNKMLELSKPQEP